MTIFGVLVSWLGDEISNDEIKTKFASCCTNEINREPDSSDGTHNIFVKCSSEEIAEYISQEINGD